MIGIAVQVFALLGASNEARADCAAGDGNIATQVTCTTPQVLTVPTGVVASGATLTTGANTTAYTVSTTNATVTNSGSMASQGPQAFLATGTGGTLTNNGSIAANQGTAIVVNPSAGLNITNTGSISGGNGTAINYAALSSGGLITQSAGTIDGTIRISGLSTTLRVTGGVINGSILDQTPASGSAGSSQNRGGVVNFDLGAGSFTTNGRIEVGAVNVQSGTLVLGNDVYVSGGQFGPGLTNRATLQISGLRTVTGSFVQSPSGTLVMQVNPQNSSQLNIKRLPFSGGGTATLAGTLALVYQPGTYQARTYTLISTDTAGLVSATGGPLTIRTVTGTFSSITGVVPTPGLAQAVTVGPTDVELTLSGVAEPANDAIFPANVTALVLNGQQANGILLDRLGTRQGGIADGPVTNGAAPARVRLAQAGNIGALGEIASALPQALAAEGAWFRGIGDFASVSGNAAAAGFSGASGGFLAGFDRAIATDLYLGVAAGYEHSDISGPASSSSGVDTGRVAVYGGGWWGPSLLSGTTGYAYDRISSARNLGGIGSAAQAHDGHEFTIAGQWSLPTPVTGIAGAAVVTPKIGVKFLHLAEDGFKETGVAGFGLSSNGNDTDSVQPYLGVTAAEKFLTGDGNEITPEIRLGYSREVLSNNRVISLAAVDGTAFLVSGVKPSRDMLNAGVGVTLRARDDVLLYANYDAILPTGNTSRHTVSAGLRVRF